MPNITMYKTPVCPYCNKAKMLLQQKGVSDITELDISTDDSLRSDMMAKLKAGELDILIGTHAVIEDPVIFDNLGLAIIDEQHRFGVMQRSRLWNKAKFLPLLEKLFYQKVIPDYLI